MINDRKSGWLSSVRAGFTLIELVVVMAVMGIISVAVFSYIASTTELYSMLKQREEIEQEAAAANIRIRREARLLKSTTVAGEADWEFVNRYSLTNRFRLSGTSLTMNDFLLATGVQDFRLSYFDATNGILAPLPLGSIDRALVRRVSAELAVGRGGQTSTIHAVFFYPEEGTVK